MIFFICSVLINILSKSFSSEENLEPYKSYFERLFNVGEIDKSWVLFEELKGRRLVPDVQMYSIFICYLVDASFPK